MLPIATQSSTSDARPNPAPILEYDESLRGWTLTDQTTSMRAQKVIPIVFDASRVQQNHFDLDPLSKLRECLLLILEGAHSHSAERVATEPLCYTIAIPIDASPSSHLQWAQESAFAASLPPDIKILWSIDLGLDSVFDPGVDSKQLCSSGAGALKTFFRDLWPRFSGQSIAIALRSGLTLELLSASCDDLESAYQNYLEIWQRLDPIWSLMASQLPDDCHCLLDINHFSAAPEITNSGNFDVTHLSSKRAPFHSITTKFLAKSLTTPLITPLSTLNLLAFQALAFNKERFEYSYPIVPRELGADSRLCAFISYDLESVIGTVTSPNNASNTNKSNLGLEPWAYNFMFSSSPGLYLRCTQELELSEMQAALTQVDRQLRSRCERALEQEEPQTQGNRRNCSHAGVTLAILLPILEVNSEKLASFLEVIELLESKSIDFRVLPETLITQLWQDLDIIATPYAITSQQVERSLKGFVASGGELYTTQELRNYLGKEAVHSKQ